MGNNWAVEPHQTVPEQLAVTLRALLESKDRRFAPALAAARAREWCVPALAVAVGMKPGAVAQRIQRANRARAAGNMRGQNLSGIAIPPAPTSAIHCPAPSRDDPKISTGRAEHLRELRAKHRLVRCNLPPAHPYRRASAHLAHDVHYLLTEKGATLVEVCRVLRVTQRAVHQLLERHGLKQPVPSLTRQFGSAFAKPIDGSRPCSRVAR